MAKNTSETISREEAGRKDDTTFKKPEQDAYQEFENPQSDESNSRQFNEEMRHPDREGDSRNLNQEIRQPGDDLNSKNYRQEPYQETEKKGKNANSNNQE
ncbi:hypothetical protein [Bacillus sp. ISL-46]|uniref:hypothetical protein n=1 Tax=Bacillus sp. ISL-46 TaxID=2819129 RepID=UPI001BE720F0|nr:hypothetical protein [Bacillus sp. ISL-46]MBT2723666.1 hypothetical protein [Bacillus sp. ISL-46]